MAATVYTSDESEMTNDYTFEHAKTYHIEDGYLVFKDLAENVVGAVKEKYVVAFEFH